MLTGHEETLLGVWLALVVTTRISRSACHWEMGENIWPVQAVEQQADTRRRELGVQTQVDKDDKLFI